MSAPGWWLVVALVLLALACGGEVSSAPCEVVTSIPIVDDAAAPDVSVVAVVDAADAGDAAPCASRIDDVVPRSVPAGSAGALVMLTGCGLSRLKEVRVDWGLRAFHVVDDGHAVFATGVVPDGRELPYLSQLVVTLADRQLVLFLKFEAAP